MDDEQSYEGAYEARKSAHKSDAVYEVRPIRKRVWTPLTNEMGLAKHLSNGVAPPALNPFSIAGLSKRSELSR